MGGASVDNLVKWAEVGGMLFAFLVGCGLREYGVCCIMGDL